ncbi:MAG: hypothetical protein WAT66_12335 [Actinomycetota bacterium]
MGKRIVFGSVIVVLLLLLSSAAASAAPGGNSSNAPGQAKRETAHESNGQGKSHALANASRGMNRVGGPGTWKSHGHVPAPVSYPQGHAPSDPDFNGNGGIDKPGQTGGFSADRDGNNGCGNDDDREDDNNGWCGKRPKEVSEQPPSPPSGPGPRVLPGPKITPPVIEGRKLPKTGFGVIELSWTGWSLVLTGHVLRRRTRRRTR